MFHTEASCSHSGDWNQSWSHGSLYFCLVARQMLLLVRAAGGGPLPQDTLGLCCVGPLLLVT